MKRDEIQTVLASAGQAPRHRFGQNFMVDAKALKAIADAGDIHAEDIILEVGPGVGNLTRQLAQRAHRGAVLAVDIDAKLLPAAQTHHQELHNVTWLCADVLAGKHHINTTVTNELRALSAEYPDGELKLVSNLPYNAASPVVAELLVLMARESRMHVAHEASPLWFSRLAFTVQYEVAERMAAKPGTADYGPLGLLIQLTSDVAITKKIPPGAFWPPPKVNSALVVIRPVKHKIAQIQDILALQRVLSGVFGHRRQRVSNALKHFLQEAWTPELAKRVTDAGIDLTARPENLKPEQYLELTDLIHGVIPHETQSE